jgi:hypothetical protein
MVPPQQKFLHFENANPAQAIAQRDQDPGLMMIVKNEAGKMVLSLPLLAACA